MIKKTKKIVLSKLSMKIKRLVEKHGRIRLEAYNRSGHPYGMRYLHKSGKCSIRYWTFRTKFVGKQRLDCCFIDDYSVYRNGNNKKIVMTTLTETLKEMSVHDRGCYKIKYIYAGGRKIKV